MIKPSSTPNSRNIELKARLYSFDSARIVAARMATDRPMLEWQVDTYFDCRHGRLKLRERLGRPAQLVWYERSNEAQAKASDYRLTEIGDPAGLRQSLHAALGGLVTIEKKREIWLWNNVRIHLDRVKGLGDFLEFESVLTADMLDEQGHAQLAELSRRFGIQPGDLIAESYSDLLLRYQFSRLRKNSRG